MEKVDLAVQPRDMSQRAAVIRRERTIPAVVYGHGIENLHIKMDYQTFRRLFEQATYSTIITLNVEGGESLPVLVHQVQYHPVSDEIVHVDFYKVNMNEKVSTHISLEFVGESDAIKQGALLNTTKHEVEVSCLPADLVHHIEVDISVLKEVGDTIRVGDVTAPQGIEILDNEEDPIVSAIEPKVAEEPAPGEEGADEAGDAGSDEGGDAGNDEGGDEGGEG